MSIPSVKLGSLSVSKLIIGGNPFSGFSHQTPQRDQEMRHYFSAQRIKETLRAAEQLGVTTHLSRADHHVMRYLMEHWDEGGKLQWMAQTCPELGPIDRGISNALAGGAKACYIHGGVMDFCVLNNQTQEIPDALKRIRGAGLPCGVAGHNPKVFQWAVDHIDVDFFMCSYYDAAKRDANAEHVGGMTEVFDNRDRDAMVKIIQNLPRPVIHYKVLAAGRNDPKDALDFVARNLRPQDAVCLGVFSKERPNELADNLAILRDALQRYKKW